MTLIVVLRALVVCVSLSSWSQRDADHVLEVREGMVTTELQVSKLHPAQNKREQSQSHNRKPVYIGTLQGIYCKFFKKPKYVVFNN